MRSCVYCVNSHASSSPTMIPTTEGGGAIHPATPIAGTKQRSRAPVYCCLTVLWLVLLCVIGAVVALFILGFGYSWFSLNNWNNPTPPGSAISTPPTPWNNMTTDIITRVVPTVPAENCSFPFTYNGQLFLQCTPNVTNVTEIGNRSKACLLARRNWAICSPPADLVVQTETINITIPNVSSPVSVKSINKWVVFQQRTSSSSVFNLPWVAFKNGFGDISSNFWLGLEKIYQLTSTNKYKLRMEMQALNGGAWYSVEYDNFYVEGEAAKYRIHVSGGGNGNPGVGFSGDINDVMNSNIQSQVHNGMAFSTFDADNDLSPTSGCAQASQGGWWYNNCFQFNLNGLTGQFILNNGGNSQQLSASRMMMKRA